MNKIKYICAYYHFTALAIGLFLTIISVRFLLFEDTVLIPEHRDIMLPPSTINIFKQYFFTWSEYGSSASFENIARIWSRFLLLFSPDVIVFSRLIFSFYYFVMFFMPYISFFYLFKDFLEYDDKYSFFTALVAALTYLFNPYVIQNFSPPHFYAFSYALLPTLVLFLVKALENDKFSSKLLLAIVITLIITLTIRYMIHVFILVVAITSLYVIRSLKLKEFSVKNFAKKYFIVTALLFLLNLYWVLPSLIISGSKALKPPYVLTYETTLMFSTSYKAMEIFTLKSAWWPTLVLRPAPFLTYAVWTLLLYFIPLLSITSFLLWRSFKENEKLLVLSALFVYLIGFSLWKGVDNPINLFSSFYSFCVFSTNPSIAWMFRVPGYFGSLVVFATVLLLSLLIVRIIYRIRISKNLAWRCFHIGLIIIIIFSSGIVSWQIFTGNLDGVLGKGYYAKDFVGKLKNGARFITLIANYDGSFKPHRTGELYFILPNDLDRYLKTTSDEQLIAHIMQIINTENLVTNMELDNSYFEKSPITIRNLNILRLKSFETQQINSINVLLLFNGDWQCLGSLSKVINLSRYGLTTETFEKSSIILNPEKHELALLGNKKVLFLAPFDYIIHHNPSQIWSRAMTSDPLHGEWHTYLETKRIENWDLDYGKGLVFTWAVARLEDNPAPNINDLITCWTFGSLNDLNQWKNCTSENQFGAIYTITLDSDALKAELWNSTWGWKTINSPPIEAEYGNWYRWEFQIKAENAHEVHVKVAEYNQDKKLVNIKYVKSIGSGIFGWKTTTIDYTPENPETKYIQLQIWHGHETTQPLPNIIWIDNVKIYDLKRFTKPVTLEIPFTLQETNEYVFLIRLFRNQQGGRIQIHLDNRKYTINTKDQLNKFTWQQIDTLTLQKGQHKITLTNLEGFNAVNLFALIPKQEYRNAQNQIEQLLQNKRIIYILEAESDLYRQNNALSNKYGGKASNGQTLELNQTSKVWINIEIIKPGNYTLAIRSRGNLTIKIDKNEYRVNSTQLEWIYIGPINLKRGNHTIEITNPMYPYLHWNFENGDQQGWEINTPTMQTLTVDEYAYDGRYSLKAELNASTGEWKTINSPLIPITPGTPYQFDFYIAGENAHSVHAKILEYDINKTYLSAKYIIGIGSGNFTWKNVKFKYTPSQNASYIQLQIWHGHETTQPLPNKIWIDDIKIYENYQPSDLDVVWLYSTQNEKETLEEIFTSNKNSAEVISYQKIDPTRYIVKVNATEPFMLSFAESYDPLWFAYVNGERIQSIPLYGVINGFWINQTGLLEISIEYEPQKWFYMGSIISVSTLIACITYLIYDWIKKKDIIKRIKKRVEAKTTIYRSRNN